MSFKLNIGYALPALLAFVFLIYFPGLNGPFMLDDYSNFVNVPTADSLWKTVSTSAMGDGTSTPYRPLSRASLILNNFYSGTESAFYHKLTNLLIHLFTGLILYAFCTLCFKAVEFKKTPIPLLITAIWLLHPLQVSTVMYVVQRMAQLSTLFTLLALIIYLHSRLRDKTGKRQPLLLPVAGISLFTILALISKESAALLPFYLLAIEFLLFCFKCKNSDNRWRLWLLQAIFVFIPLILALVYFAGHHEQLLNYASRNFTLSDRLLTQSVVVVFYLGQILFPRLSSMGLFHDDFMLHQSADLVVIFSILVLISLIGIAIVTRKKYPLVAFGIIWFLVSHLLESTVLPLEMVFEHRNYLALFGPVLSMIVGLKIIADKNRVSVANMRLMAFSLLFILSLQTVYRVSGWSSEESFAATHLINHPDSERTHNLLAQIAFKQGKTELALSELKQVYRINPGDMSYQVLQVQAGCHTGVTKQQMVAAINATATTQQEKPARNILYAIRNIEHLFSTERCKNISAKDLLDLTQAMVENPVIRNIPLKYHLYARAQAANNQLAVAKKFYLKSWRAKPQNLQPAFELISLLRNNMMVDESCSLVYEVMHAGIDFDSASRIEINTLSAKCRQDQIK